MPTFVPRVLLLQAYAPPAPGPGNRMFLFGRALGAIGRVLLVLFIVGAIVAAVLDPGTTLISFLLAYVIVPMFVIAEVASSCLMLQGHRKAARYHGVL